MMASFRRGPLEYWALDGFNARSFLPAGLWRYSAISEYLVGLIASHPAIAPRGRKQREGGVPLRATDQRRLFGDAPAWNRVRTHLISNGIIECDETYEIGRKCKHYRLGASWQDRGIHREVIRDTRLLARLHDFRQSPVRLSPPHEHLVRFLHKVQVDETEARPWTCQSHRSLRQRFTALKVDVIQSGVAPFVVDNYGRFHTPITSLRRAVRPALRIDGQKLTELDVSCAQPLLLAYVVAKILAGDWSLESVRRLGTRGPMLDAFDGLELIPWSIEPPTDLLEFKAVCESGLFYRTMSQVWNLSIDTRRELYEVKRRVFKYVLFGRVRHGSRSWLAFRRRWPSVARVLELIKGEDHGTSSRACQRLETRLMISGMVERLRSNHADLPLTTIHDSALVIANRDAVAIVGRLMRGEFNTIGLTPQIKENVA